MRAGLTIVLLSAALGLVASAGTEPAVTESGGIESVTPAVDAACAEPGTAEYATHDCKVQRLRARSFTVVAVVDSGINPYHVDFRLPAGSDLVGVHPSEYLEGYPADAARMQPAFEAGSVDEARSIDSDEWARSSRGELTWVDGTNIVGGYSGSAGDDFFDTHDLGHGTAVASQAAGRVLGPGHEDVLLVAVDLSEWGVEWAANQPWIDAISISYATLVPVGPTVEATWDAAAEGKVVCAATGNNTVPMWAFHEQGPSWHVHVGAVDADDREVQPYSAFPADVLGVTHVPVATHTSMTESREFGGTSGATPAVCGLIAQTIADARARLGDVQAGPKGGGVLARGTPAAGAAADGELTRREVEDAVMATATASDNFARGGYGIVDGDSVTAALEVLFGERARPDRPEADAWIATTDGLRDAVWGPPPP